MATSWVIRNTETKAVIAETFNPKVVAALNTAKYEAVPIRAYLSDLNAPQIKVGSNVSFVHEGAGYRVFGVVVATDGDSVTIDVDGRHYEVSIDLDSVKPA